MSHPIVEITVDGTPVAGGFYERLISFTVTDKEGIQSDTFDMELNDGPEVGFLKIPRMGAVVDIRVGYGTAASLGTFIVDKVQCKCLPYGMSIGGKALDLGNSKAKERKDRHWDNAKVKDIVSDVAGDMGLSASIDPEIGEHEYPIFIQQDESPIHVLRRLERRHNGLFKAKSGHLVFSKRGSGNSAGGTFMGSVIVTPGIIIQGTCTFEANDRTKYSKVVAYFQDKDKAERVAIEADGNADAESEYRITEPFSSVEEADKAAQSKANDLKRNEGATQVTVVGNPGITSGAALMYSGVRPGLDGMPYIIDTATHTYSKTEGYKTQISGKLYDGSSSGGGSGDGTTDGTVAPDSPAGTPATPSGWTPTSTTPSADRLGSTDAN